MGIKELAAKVAEKHTDITTPKAMAMLRTAFEALHEELSTTEEKGVKLPPLGHFKLSDKTAKEAAEGASAGEDGESKRKILLRLAREHTGTGTDKVKPDMAAKRAEKKGTREAGKAQRQATRKENAADKK